MFSGIKLSRRELSKALLSASAVGISAKSLSAPRTPDRTFEHGAPLEEFSYGQIDLAAGPQQAQLEQTQGILMGLDEDSLLRPFRAIAGRPAPGRDLGGWYSSPAWGPATFGQWVSAIARYYAATGDEAARLKVTRLVDALSETVDSTGKIFKLVETPAYLYDKLVCGLMDAHQFASHGSALELLSKATRAAAPQLPGRALDRPSMTEGDGSESYTVPENQFIAWQRGADPLHLRMARDYLHDGFFDPLSKSQNVLPGRHAYSHVNALCSAAKAYLVLGDSKYLKAAVNGFDFVDAQSYATGGWGPVETFLPKPAIHQPGLEIPAIADLGDSILNWPAHFETPCGAYAHFKLTRYLLRITRDPRYGDSMERVMYNTVLGALPLNKYGKAFYQSNYHRAATKEYFDGYFHNMEETWPCCSGTLPQVAADYRISAYFRDAQGVFVNLYIPSTLRWAQSGAQVSLTQSGDYPLSNHVAFNVEASRPTVFTLHLRIPAWARQPVLQINGKATQRVEPGTFAAIRREWRSGDRVELMLPRQLELKSADEHHPDLVALVCGPMVLFAVGALAVPVALQVMPFAPGESLPKLTRETLLAARQTTAASTEWKSDTSQGPVIFRPWWAIRDGSYTTYFDVS